ncbi:MAG: DUF4956 domain-containing protein [Pseudomonadales bacterium]|jgi:hypothetical protein|nr:DUF4956 domain-containing protein [Pseudomonadales bacterium]
MRPATRSRGPVFLISVYYGALLAFAWYARSRPEWTPLLPFGGIDELAASGADSFEVVTSAVEAGIMAGFDAKRLAIAMLGAALLMVPVSWVYFITTRTKRVDQSFVQTILILPILVAGIAVIVANSLALAFSLAGIFAAVRFRFTLEDPAHTLYIFLAIVVGLGAGVGALGVSIVTSMAFVYVTLLLWVMEYGADLKTPLFGFLTGRDSRDEGL